jgi:hypothetical protein
MLRSPEIKKLINSFESDTIVVVDGIIHIKGFGSFKAIDVINCNRVCPKPGQLKKTLLHVVIPDSCECPETYEVTVVALPNYQEYETDTTFDTMYFKEYEHPVGGTFTAAQAAAGLVEQINLDPAIPVTAIQADAGGNPDAAGEYILLTQKAGFAEYNAYNPAGTVVVTVPFVAEILSVRTLKKLFPIQFGHFGANPDLPNCGEYCKYWLKIRDCCSNISDAYDISMDRTPGATETEVEFYVNKDAAGWKALWDDKLLEQIPCLQPGSSSSPAAIIIT